MPDIENYQSVRRRAMKRIWFWLQKKRRIKKRVSGILLFVALLLNGMSDIVARIKE